MAVAARDLRVAMRGGGAGMPMGFFLAVGVLLPFGIGPDPALLAGVSAGSIWIAALLACLLALDRMYRADLEDGSMALLATSPLPLEMTVVAKCSASWIVSGLPIAAASPALAMLHGLPPADWPGLALSLMMGTMALTMLGSVGAALAASLRAPGLLAPLMVLPMTVPVLIFGAAAASGAEGAMMLLGAVALGALAVTPWAAAAALKSGME